MSPNDLFAEALPLRHPWMVEDSRLESKPGEPRRLHLVVALEEDCRRLPCPECQAPDCPIHDRVERRWKHLNFWQYETILSARVPRVKCEQCGVHQVEVPWAREGSGFTLLFEAMAMLLSRHMGVSEAAEMLGEYDTRIWRVVSHYVDQARGAADWSGVRRVAVDEVSRRNFLFISTAPIPPEARGRRGFGTSLRPELIALLKQMSYRSGDALVFSDLSALMEHVRGESEAWSVFSILSRTPSVMLRLEIDGKSDIGGIADYWSAGPDRRLRNFVPLLQALAAAEEGERIDVAHLLPPLARKLLFTYRDLSMMANGIMPDCHWTSLNFFNPQPEPLLLDERLATTVVLEQYEAVAPPLPPRRCPDFPGQRPRQRLPHLRLRRRRRRRHQERPQSPVALGVPDPRPREEGLPVREQRLHRRLPGEGCRPPLRGEGPRPGNRGRGPSGGAAGCPPRAFPRGTLRRPTSRAAGRRGARRAGGRTRQSGARAR